MVEDLHELGRLTDANLAGSWVNIGGHCGEVGGSPECPFVATGLPAAFFNGVYAMGPVDDPDQLIADAAAFMAERGVPWLLWVREGVDDALLDAGRRAGLADAGGPLAMALPVIPEIPPVPEGLEITVVRDAAGLEVARDLGARGFEMPREFVDVLAAESMLDDPTVVMVTGSVDGVPVSTALVGVTGSTAGIYNVATPPEHRRRGYGEALTWAAVAEGRRLSCDHSVLQASPMGAPVYRSMGYVDLGTYVQLACEPATQPGSVMGDGRRRQRGEAAAGWEANAETVAAGWEANADWTDARLRPVTVWLIEQSGVHAGDIVLDLAAGPGGVGHLAAELVGPEGRVLSTDLAPAMVDAARRIGAQRGLSNIEYRVMDAQAMDLEDDAVDVVVCRSGFMLMPNPVEALREARRVLRPGGHLAFSVFAAPERNPFVGVPLGVFIELGHVPPPPLGAPGVFAMSDPSRLREALVEAGFQVEAIETIDLEGPFPNEEVIVDRILEVNPQVGPVYRSLDDDEQAAARQALIDRFGAFRQQDGTLVLPTQMWGVHAR